MTCEQTHGSHQRKQINNTKKQIDHNKSIKTNRNNYVDDTDDNNDNDSQKILMKRTKNDWFIKKLCLMLLAQFRQLGDRDRSGEGSDF